MSESGERLTAVILPGMDATGLLLTDFTAALEPNFNVRVIEYPTDVSLGYSDLEDYVRDRLPDEPFVLIGESFSGPIALRLAATMTPPLKGLVMAASFCVLPLPFRSLCAAIVRRVPVTHVPMALVSEMMWGSWRNKSRDRLLIDAIERVDPFVIDRRINEALKVDLKSSGLRIACPLLYLQAAKDRLIFRAAARDLADASSDFRLESFDAPHFLLQVRPEECAAAILKFTRSIESATARVAYSGS